MKLAQKLKQVEDSVNKQENKEFLERVERLSKYLESDVFEFSVKHRHSKGLNYVLIAMVLQDAEVPVLNDKELFQLTKVMVQVTGFQQGDDVTKLYFS